AAAILRREETRMMPYMRLLKLLYIADRESMRDTGRPITGDQAIAMTYGPVLQGVYNLIRNTHYESWRWSKFFQTSGYKIKMTKDPGAGRLSRYELEKLREVVERYAVVDDFDLVEETHGFEEWRANFVKGASQPILAEHILKAVGLAGEVEQIAQDEK